MSKPPRSVAFPRSDLREPLIKALAQLPEGEPDPIGKASELILRDAKELGASSHQLRIMAKQIASMIVRDGRVWKHVRKARAKLAKDPLAPVRAALEETAAGLGVKIDLGPLEKA